MKIEQDLNKPSIERLAGQPKPLFKPTEAAQSAHFQPIRAGG
jgi:hypothetical protein